MKKQPNTHKEDKRTLRRKIQSLILYYDVEHSDKVGIPRLNASNKLVDQLLALVEKEKRAILTDLWYDTSAIWSCEFDGKHENYENMKKINQRIARLLNKSVNDNSQELSTSGNNCQVELSSNDNSQEEVCHKVTPTSIYINTNSCTHYEYGMRYYVKENNESIT